MVLMSVAQHAAAASMMGCEKRFLLLYFTAKWVPGCTAFTHKLKQFMQRHGGHCETMFVTLDKTNADFDDMRQRVPWWSINYDNVDTIQALVSAFRVTDAPTLVVLEPATGQLIDENVAPLMNLSLTNIYERWVR